MINYINILRMNSIEYRIKLFQDLHNNKWFHIMNYNLDVLKSLNRKDNCILIKYGSCFYF
jgi:hypothetical protein